MFFAVMAVALATLWWPAASSAACQQWGVSQQVSLHQQVRLGASPIQYLVFMRLRQDGTQLAGEVEHFHAVNPPRPGTGLKGNLGGRGPASGFIRGNVFEITVAWTAQQVAVYRGTIDGEGHANGITFAREKPGSKMDWYTTGPLPCAVEPGVDRQGGDYRNFDLASASYEACRAACTGEPQCRAYTYVKPGVQGPRARCWLKSSRPDKRSDGCCVSGVVH